MSPERIALTATFTYRSVRDAALWAIVLYLLEAPQWTFGTFGALAGVWYIFMLKGILTDEVRKRSKDARGS